MKDMLTLLVSLCFSEFIHNMIEIWGMRQKVSWLALSLKGKNHGKWPVNIDTKVKTLVLHVLVLLITGGGGFVLLKFLNPTDESLITLGIIVLILNYIVTTYKVDKFHSEIGKIIKSVK